MPKKHIPMHEFFDCHQEAQAHRFRAVKGLVDECSFADSPCPLLASQLDEYIVLANKAAELARRLRGSLERVDHG